MFDYSRLQNSRCLGPECSIQVENPSEPSRSCKVRAIVDTGAVMTLVPKSELEQLGNVKDYGRVYVRDANDNVERKKTYLINIRIADYEFSSIEVVVSPKPYALIGRDILNQHKVMLNAPELIGRLDCQGSCDS